MIVEQYVQQDEKGRFHTNISIKVPKREEITGEMMIPDYAGGNFENFIARVKYRVRVGLMFGMLKINVTAARLYSSTSRS